MNFSPFHVSLLNLVDHLNNALSSLPILEVSGSYSLLVGSMKDMNGDRGLYCHHIYIWRVDNFPN